MTRLTIAELDRIAEKALTENGFLISEPPNVRAEIQSLAADFTIDATVRDLRSLAWSSIDDADSRDLDQIEYAEKLSNGDVRLLVAIADVDRFAAKDSATDEYAAHNTISIYTGGRVFPMLPEKLSTDLTSLLGDADRFAVVCEIVVCENGDVQSSDVYRAAVHNYAKLSYAEIGAWLEGKTEIPASVAKIAGMEAQLRLQQEVAARLYEFRKKHGALEFETIESAPVVADGAIVGIEAVGDNAARKIIENFMIATNVETAEFLERRSVPSLRRVVKTPERWDRIVEIAAKIGVNLPPAPDAVALAELLARRKIADPLHYPDLSLSVIKMLGAGEYVVQAAGAAADGHFGLGVRDYAHSTAPNRRYADLIVQRLVKATLDGKPSPYTVEELTQIAACCNERGSAARKVERLIRKTIAASVMASRIGENFEAIVTGINVNGTFARIINPPIDGRVVAGEKNLKVGDKVMLKLIATDQANGYIDFAA